MNRSFRLLGSLIGALMLLQGCTMYPPITDISKQLSVSMVKDDVLVVSGYYGNADGLVQLNAEARLRAAEIGRSMGYEAFQIIHEAGAEFSNAIVGRTTMNQFSCDPTTSINCSTTSLYGQGVDTGYGYSSGGFGSYFGYYNWGRFVEDAPIHHSSWASSPLYAEDGYRYRLVVRLLRYDSGKMPSRTFNINEVLQASHRYKRSHLLDPYWNALERR